MNKLCIMAVSLFLTPLGCIKVDKNLSSMSEHVAVKQILSAEKLSAYKANLPKIGYPELERILNASETFWYDKSVMQGTYQDSIGDPIRSAIGARFNNRGADLIIPEGRPIFSEDGKRFAFPFGETAGTDHSTNIVVANFLSLPQKNGKLLPVTYWTNINPRAGLGLARWRWVYPLGTMLGELIYVRSSDGQLYLTEVRTRRRYESSWSTNIYRPFPTVNHLRKAIEKLRPDWQSQPNLQRFMQELGRSDSIEPVTLAAGNRLNQAWSDTFNQSGFVDRLPIFNDEQLVKDLLIHTVFVSAYEAEWKRDDGKVAFAPTTSETFSIVPVNYEAGVLAVNETSCTRCHQDAGRPIENFADRAELYGDIWGQDQIFSFHPWDESRIKSTLIGPENRIVDSRLVTAGIIAPFSIQAHNEEYYRESTVSWSYKRNMGYLK